MAAGTGEQIDYQETVTRQTYRITPTAEIRGSDFFGNSFLAHIFGKSDLTGLFEKTTVVTSQYQYASYALTAQWDADNNLAQNTGWQADKLGAYNQFDFVAYLGPSLQSANSASGANLNNIDYVVAPPSQQIVQNWNSTWNIPTNPSAPGYIDPQAPYTYTNAENGKPVTTIQWENPANYVGWQEHSRVTWLNAARPFLTSHSWSPTPIGRGTSTSPKASPGRATCLTAIWFPRSDGARTRSQITNRPPSRIRHTISRA